MKTNYLRFISPVIAAAFLSFVTSCEEDNPAPDGTTFNIVEETVDVPVDGGTFSVSYELANPVESQVVTPSEEVDWIDNIVVSPEGSITFDVAANTGTSPRTADISVTYGELSDKFTVIQAAADASAAFILAIDEILPSGAVISVTPRDEGMTYLPGGISVANLNTFPDDDTFVSGYLIPYYEDIAKANGLTVEQLMSQLLLKGNKSDIKISGMKPEMDYYVFCIGFTEKLEPLSELVKKEFTTMPLEAFKATIEVSVSGPLATAVVTPEDENAGYFVVALEGHGLDDATIRDLAQQEVEWNIGYMMQWGFSRGSAVASLTNNGAVEVELTDLKAATNYTLCAIAIDVDGYLISNPATHEFVTGDAPLSDNVITVEYENISSRRADYTVYPSNEDTYVFFCYQYTEELKAMSDDEAIKFVMEKEDMEWYKRKGEVTSYSEALFPETEYVIFSFGYQGGVATTRLFKSTFTTKEAEVNGFKFEANYGPYYNGDEVAEKYPDMESAAGLAVFPTSWTVTGGTTYAGVYHFMYVGDLSDKDEYPDEVLYYALREDGFKAWHKTMTYLSEFDQVYTLCGYVESEDGNFSELYRQVVGPFTKDGCSPVDGFVKAPAVADEPVVEMPSRLDVNTAAVEAAAPVVKEEAPVAPKPEYEHIYRACEMM